MGIYKKESNKIVVTASISYHFTFPFETSETLFLEVEQHISDVLYGKIACFLKRKTQCASNIMNSPIENCLIPNIIFQI